MVNPPESGLLFESKHIGRAKLRQWSKGETQKNVMFQLQSQAWQNPAVLMPSFISLLTGVATVAATSLEPVLPNNSLYVQDLSQETNSRPDIQCQPCWVLKGTRPRHLY